MEIANEVNSQFPVFHKQLDAIAFQKNSMPQHRCFSFEMPSPLMREGGRKFFVAELSKFWFWYRNLYRLPRHFYEIIQEGFPCRLYFDLEYKKTFNTDLDENVALFDFLQLVCLFIKETFHLDITQKSFVLLDSSTTEKFSIHAICHFPNNYLFANNIVMRDFVVKLTERMAETKTGIINTEKGETFLCDCAVYTRNRSFRFFLSSKCKKDAIFKLCDACKFYNKNPTDERQIFLDSLVIPSDFSSSPILKFDETITTSVRKLQTTFKVSNIPTDSSMDNDEYEILGEGVPPSYLPELDEHVRQFLSRYNKAVEIRSWTLLRQKNNGSFRIKYHLNKSRYCLRIQREHVSNNVYWICLLDQKCMFQRCLDTECRGFTSTHFALPTQMTATWKSKLNSVLQNSSTSSKEIDSINVNNAGDIPQNSMVSLQQHEILQSPRLPKLPRMAINMQ